MTEFKLKILEADDTAYDDNCISLVIPTSEGMYGIQANHLNMFAALQTGLIKYTMPDGQEKYLSVSGGMVKVENNEVLILADSLEAIEDIDLARAEKEEKEAEDLLSSAGSDIEMRNAEEMMKRAINRIKLKQRYGGYK